MNIFANTVVTLTFELFDADDTLLEETDEPIVYLHGGHSGMPPKLEESLNHKKAGDSVSVTLEPDDAFGEYDPELVKIEPLDRPAAGCRTGMMFEAHAGDDDEDGRGMVFTVTDIADGKAVLDGNHALGRQARALRVHGSWTCGPPPRRRSQHGHVHGPGGHHHH